MVFRAEAGRKGGMDVQMPELVAKGLTYDVLTVTTPPQRSASGNRGFAYRVRGFNPAGGTVKPGNCAGRPPSAGKSPRCAHKATGTPRPNTQAAPLRGVRAGRNRVPLSSGPRQVFAR